jgi:hypothetical protein
LSKTDEEGKKKKRCKSQTQVQALTPMWILENNLKQRVDIRIILLGQVSPKPLQEHLPPLQEVRGNGVDILRLCQSALNAV